MPLPAGDMTWPPTALADITPTLNQWSAWYSGSTDDLGSAYGGNQIAGPRVLSTIRPSQFSGGLVGSVARWFWGQPNTDGSQRNKLHVPLAADIATASADLLFAEQPRIITPETTTQKARRDRLNTMLAAIGWESLLPEAAEVASAMSGVYLRIVWDDDVAKHPLITAVHADAAFPEFQFGQLRAVTFWQIVNTSGSTVLRHLERHEAGRIEHGLYEGDAGKLGKRVPLTEHPSTAEITVDDLSGIDTGSELLTAVYVPNVRPTRRWRNHPIGSNLGRSDFDGIEPQFDSIDEVFTSWMRDVRLAKARLLVDQTMLETNGVGGGASFDTDREVFTGLNMMGDGGDGAPITPQQFEIRAADHEATIRWIVGKAIGSAGYSLQTFGADGEGGAVTATEVSSKDRRSMTTREKKTRYWSPALAHILQALMQVDAAKFGGPGPFETLTIEFPPSVQPTPLELANTASVLTTAQAASIETKVRLIHPDWIKQDVDDEVARIQAEQSFTVPDLGPLSEPPASDES